MREKGVDTLPIQPAMNENIIKHSRDCKPSRGEGRKENGTGRENTGDEKEYEQRKDCPIDSFGEDHW